MDKVSEQLQWLENLLAELEQCGHSATAELRAAVERLKNLQKPKHKPVPAPVDAPAIVELPLDMTDLFTEETQTDTVHADSIADGLVLSLCNLGRVDIGYIASITGTDMKTVICTLRGAIYQNPETWNECF